MISQERAREIEAIFASLGGVKPDEFRDYVRRHIDRPRGADGREVTGLRWQRGAGGASGRFVRDPEGTDPLPPGYEAPPA